MIVPTIKMTFNHGLEALTLLHEDKGITASCIYATVTMQNQDAIANTKLILMITNFAINTSYESAEELITNLLTLTCTSSRQC
jgi:hypothetical protein